MKRNVFIDFDNIFSTKSVPENLLVLTDEYNVVGTLNINAGVNYRADILEEFELYCIDSFNHFETSYRADLECNKIFMFNKFFSPLGQWIFFFKDLIAKGEVTQSTEITFSSFANNRKISIVAAEGETNGHILYQKSYFLSFYLVRFLKDSGFSNIRFGKSNTFKAIASYYLRGALFLNLKALQLLFYKFFVWKRDSNLDLLDFDDPLLIVSSRGIIQTQFVEGFYCKIPKKILMIINESSNKPFRNLKETVNSFQSYFFAEGYVPIRDFFSEYFKSIRKYFYSGEKGLGSFCGIDICLSDMFPELGIHIFHMNTYAVSVNNALTKLKINRGLKINKIVSFEMLPPFAHYLKVKTLSTVVQIQSTAIMAWEYPRFTYADQFYFSSRKAFIEHLEVNSKLKDNFNVLDNMKYMGLKKKDVKSQFKNITYFTQPVFFDDELKLLNFLIKFSKTYDMKLSVKLHPRSNIPNCDLTDVKILDGKVSSQQAILESDLVITRNSSIGLDSWFANVPIVFFVNGLLKADNMSYIPKDYLGAIKHDVSIDEFSLNLNQIINNFYSHQFHEDLRIDENDIFIKLLGNTN